MNVPLPFVLEPFMWLPRGLEVRANPPETVRLVLLLRRATIIPSIPCLCCYHLIT